MEKKKLTFVPDGNNTYAGFDGAEIVALVVPYYPFGESGSPAWQWCARTRYGWAFPIPDRRQCEAELEDALRRVANYIEFHSGDCVSVDLLSPEEVDT